jgi:Ankyrin repeat
MDYLKKIIIDFEIQDIEGIKHCFENGINPNQIHNNKPLIYELINMYSRGPKVKECIKVFVDYGLIFNDIALLAIMLDDDILLEKELIKQPNLISKTYNLDCTFTPLFEATLLHICAEYNHLNCAKMLVKYGADIDAKAGLDEHGFGGQSPIFHTVNQNRKYSFDLLKYLITQKASPHVTIKGLIWGKGYEWETFIPAVNPISYAMMGLLRQFQREEKDIYQVVNLLMKHAYSIEYFPENIPNAYLN